jgi:hypothetical protein
VTAGCSFDDFVGGFGPGEWLPAFVLVVDEDADRGGEVFDAVKVPRQIAWRVMIPKEDRDPWLAAIGRRNLCCG